MTSDVGTHMRGLNPVAKELARDFPLLWEQADSYDFAERLGGCTDPLLREIDQALRELWSARTARAERESNSL